MKTYTFPVSILEGGDTPVKYRYHKAYPSTFEDPGNDATIEIVAVKFGSTWESPDMFPQLDVHALTESAWEHYEESRTLNSTKQLILHGWSLRVLCLR